MLRQLARLGHPVPRGGPRALALAVYAGGDDAPVAAREAGFEGVACVDDAARALQLYCDIWSRTRVPWALRWCEGLLDFILAMQDEDGRFVNFILDWDGTPNRLGRTSVAGGAFWQARAVLGLAHAARILDDERIGIALERGWRHVVAAEDVPADVRALHMTAALVMLGGPPDADLRHLLDTWSDELSACSRDGMLMNSPYERGHPHLWGHVQESVLAEAGALLGRGDLVDTARRSADLVFAAAVAGGFDRARTQPYDVASCIEVLTTLHRVTRVTDYGRLAASARSWFDGRNPSGQPVYDRAAGRVADGVDHGRVSASSGAEANIVAAQVLLDDAVAVARKLGGGALPTAVERTPPPRAARPDRTALHKARPSP